MREWGKVLVAFVVIELKCLFFPIAILAGLAFTKLVPLPIPRYDAMLVYCLLLQWAMVKRGMETVGELRAVCVFHILGLALEINRTSVGAWTYPDPGHLRIGHVPLFSGFMYAGVASYILQAWRRFDLAFEKLPDPLMSAGFAVAGYASFFIWRDSRWMLIALILLLFVRSNVRFTVRNHRLSLPLGLCFAGIGTAIWVGENAGTFLGAWRYPNQAHGWQMVDLSKAAAWFMLVTVGFLIVERYKTWEGRRSGKPVECPVPSSLPPN